MFLIQFKPLRKPINVLLSELIGSYRIQRNQSTTWELNLSKAIVTYPTLER